MLNRNKTTKLTTTAVAIAALFLPATFGYAGETCGKKDEVRYVADPKLVPEGQTVLSEADALLLETFSLLDPVGGVERTTGFTSDGNKVSIARQSFEFTSGFGALGEATLTCSHQGCEDSDCLIFGCDPIQVGNRWGCTGAVCIADPNSEETCEPGEPKGCIKNVAIQILD